MYRRAKLTLIAATSLLAISTVIEADDFIAGSRIQDVTVFRDGAMIVRHGTIALPAGNHTITLQGLPSTLDTDLIRASFAQRGIDIRQIKLKTVHATEVSDERRQKILSDIKALQADIRVLADGISTAKIQFDYITRLSPATAKDSGQSALSPAELLEILQFMGKNSNSLKETIRTAEVNQATARDEINRLQRELGSRSRGKFSYNVEIKAFAAQPQTSDFSLTYTVDRAAWWLRYDGELDSVANRVSLTQFAQVTQESGENWQGATITLSTEKPSLETQAPELNPNFVDVIDPPAILRKAPSERRMRQSADFALAPVAEPSVEEIVVSATRAVNTDYSTSFQLASGTTIMSSPDEQSFELLMHEQKVAIKAVAIPHEEETAYIQADLTYDGTTPLYAGTMTLFRNGIYAGEAWMDTILVNQDASLAMGQDSKITVSLIDEGQNRDEKGIFNKDTEKHYRYAYTIENHHDRAVPIEVRAVRPTSINEKLEIEALKGSTKPSITDWQDLKGVYAWNKTLAPGATWSIKHHYKLEFPKGMQVVNRR